jgi:hypothetical protein
MSMCFSNSRLFSLLVIIKMIVDGLKLEKSVRGRNIVFKIAKGSSYA